MNAEAIPQEIIINPEDKAVVVTPEVNKAFPELAEAFQDANEAFWHDTTDYLENLGQSVFSFRSKGGLRARVTASLITGENPGNELAVVYAPFSDGPPNSSTEDIRDYMLQRKPISKSRAAPNSWSQVTKSVVLSELLRFADDDMPVLTIFSPVPTGAYNYWQRREFKLGDFRSAANITEEAVDIVQEKLHGRDSETQITKLHLHGASLGASNAIGAGSEFHQRGYDFDIRSVTAQELIIGPKNIPDLAAKFMVKSTVGEASDIIVPADYPRIKEPHMRNLIDRDGYELATFGRMLNGMSKRTYLKGLTKPGKNMMPHNIEYLLENDVPLVVALAENSGLTQDTAKYLTGHEDVIHIRAESGHKANHLVNEHVALTALIATLNIRRSR